MLSIEETFKKGAASYELEAKKHKYNAYRHVAKLLPRYLRPEAKVLDIGVGTGLSSKNLIKSGFRVTGIDISKEMLRKADRYGFQKLYRMDFNKGLKFRPSSFDAVVMIAVLEFSKDPKRLFKEIFTILKKRGLLAVTMPIKQKRKIKYFRTFKQQKFEEMLERTGFEIKISKRIFGWKLSEGKFYYRLYIAQK